jgi:SAM-dependent methyltransferase
MRSTQLDGSMATNAHFSTRSVMVLTLSVSSLACDGHSHIDRRGRGTTWHDRPVPLEGLSGDRRRAMSFGSVAEEYDRLRPPYPAAFLDDLTALGPTRVLDVGCGTGKVARALMERGFSVLGVEPDEAMADVALHHGVPVEIARFEAWDPAGRTFDLVTAGHSWHWIDPVPGWAKVASILDPGGTVALFWNYHAVDARSLAAFEATYAACAPELQIIGRDPTGSPDADPFSMSDQLGPGVTRTYRWLREVSSQDWVSMLATFSDHRELGQDRLQTLQEMLRNAIDELGGSVRSRCGTYVWLAQRAEGTPPHQRRRSH